MTLSLLLLKIYMVGLSVFWLEPLQLVVEVECVGVRGGGVRGGGEEGGGSDEGRGSAIGSLES